MTMQRVGGLPRVFAVFHWNMNCISSAMHIMIITNGSPSLSIEKIIHAKAGVKITESITSLCQYVFNTISAVDLS